MKYKPNQEGKDKGGGADNSSVPSVTNLPTEDDMIALARLTIFQKDRQKEHELIQKEERKKRQPRPH